jgi:hypothetical protein
MIRPRRTPEPRKETIRKWVAGGDYAVCVEIEVEYPVDAPEEPCLTPETVRYLEQLAESARRGDVAALRKAGTVYERQRDSQQTGAPASQRLRGFVG